jgi:hypothetical protein
MDILNWLYLVKNNFVRTTPSSENDLLVVGAKVGFTKRGDKYQNYALSLGDLAASTASTLGVESGTYIPDWQTGAGTIESQSGFYTKVGNIVNVTVKLDLVTVGANKDFRVTIPFPYDPITGDGFTNANQAFGLIMRLDPNPAGSVTESKLGAFVGSDEVRIQYNGGDTSDTVTLTFMYEVLSA